MKTRKLLTTDERLFIADVMDLVTNEPEAWEPIRKCIGHVPLGTARRIARTFRDETLGKLKAPSKEHCYSPTTDRCTKCDALLEDEVLAPTKCGELQR
jgi:hypothetical protein